MRSPNGRKSGGAAGYPGSTLEWVDEPDEIEQQVMETCQGYGASLVEMPIVEWQCAQVHDLVPIEIRVKEHQVAVSAANGAPLPVIGNRQATTTDEEIQAIAAIAGKLTELFPTKTFAPLPP